MPDFQRDSPPQPDAERTASMQQGAVHRLSMFIRGNIEPILAEWEAFARTLPRGETMDITALRDHAGDMLRVIADDLDRPQTAQEQADKALGESDAEAGQVATAAQQHGAGRAESGFTVGQMVAEFRALRASVMRLWSKEYDETAATDLRDMIRFNEAIDQAIAESITRYTEEVGQSTERFLAILGHDLRNPVGAVITSTSFMLENAAHHRDLPEPYLSLTKGVARSARRMHQMVADLVEFARVSFGQTIPVERTAMDLEPLVRDAVAEVRSASRGRDIRAQFSGDLRGEWDRDRLFQALTNLVGNAIQHGSASGPVHVTTRGERDTVTIAVRNDGPVMGSDQIARLFQGMNGVPRDGRDRRHLGLGLYIVDKIVGAHGGHIEVDSNEERGTTFTVHLPRTASTTTR
jgi:signal transduction histidine kinase